MEGYRKDFDEGKRENYFKVKKLNVVALWEWDIDIDNCAICRNSLRNVCIECQAETATEINRNCIVAWGICNHAYHYHCISQWLKNRSICPLDSSDWSYQKYGNLSSAACDSEQTS